MSRPEKKTLSKVSIGAYISDNRGRTSVLVDDPSLCIRQGALYDEGMGYLNKPGWPACSGDHAACFGRMGYIPLNSYILNPVFDTVMIYYLSLYQYAVSEDEGPYLKMRDGVASLVERHKTLKGFRRLKAISEDVVNANPWKIWPEGGSVRYKIGKEKDDYINISGTELRELLSDATYRYTSEDTNVSLQDIGLNPDIAKPEDFVRGDIPVLPNIMRAPQKDSSVSGNCIRGENHPFTEMYLNIITAAKGGNPMTIRSEWMNLIKNGEKDNMKSAVFSSEKTSFLRGGMLAKVGGQIARSVVAPNPQQRPDQVGIPRKLAKDISYRIPVTEENLDEIVTLIQQGYITHILHMRTGEYIKVSEFSSFDLVPGKMLVLRELQDGDLVLINRQPTLHKNSILGFEVYLHDYDVIYIHNSATKSFGMDFDGDEANAIFPYTPLGMREVKELMFIEYNMASLASSSLLVGYHQDVNLGAHMMTMESTYIPAPIWEEMARIVYDIRWSQRYDSYDAWFSQFSERTRAFKIEIYSGRSLYSTLLPEDMEWSMGNARITRGILISGLLESKTTSGASSSIGMVIYRTYGSKETLSWLNASYRMINLWLIQKGITLGFPHLLLNDQQQREITSIKRSINTRDDLRIESEMIIDPVLRARTESEISQELSNARETISVEVMNPKDINLTLNIKGRVIGNVILSYIEYSILPDCKREGICLEYDPLLSLPSNRIEDQSERQIVLPSIESEIDIDLYTGSVRWTTQEVLYTWSMGIFTRIQFTLERKEIRGDSTFDVQIPVDRTYTTPNPLRIMIESGARGNATNAIQIAGIIGQQSFGGGRIPRMLESSQTAQSSLLGIRGGPRSMPCYAFGDNTPISRGFIPESYLEGMPIDRYMSAHVASRENLTSNTDLTPRTGYFERRVRTFTENLRISRVNGMTAVTNERGIIVMCDYLLDPSRVFSVGKGMTFVDINFEMRRLRARRSENAIVMTIPYRPKIQAYLRIDRSIQRVLSSEMSKNTDIILICDPRIEIEHPSFIEYLHQMYVPERSITVIQEKDRSFALGMTEYQQVTMIPSTTPSDLSILRSRLPSDAIAMIDVSTPSLNTSLYKTEREQPIPFNVLSSMMISGSQFMDLPFILRPEMKAFADAKRYTLLETLILNGIVYST